LRKVSKNNTLRINLLFMKVYFFDELMNMSGDQLLDLLSNYMDLRDDMCKIMGNDLDMREHYIQQYLYFYLLNISKIKTTLKSKLEIAI